MCARAPVFLCSAEARLDFGRLELLSLLLGRLDLIDATDRRTRTPAHPRMAHTQADNKTTPKEILFWMQRLPEHEAKSGQLEPNPGRHVDVRNVQTCLAH